jgi:hypothetical protein
MRGVAEYDCAERCGGANGHGDGYNCGAWLAPAISRWLAKECAISTDADDFDISGYVPADGRSVAILAARAKSCMDSSCWVCSAGHSGVDADFLWWRLGEWRRGHQPTGRNVYRYSHGEFHLRRDYVEPQHEAYFGCAVRNPTE